MKNLFTPDNAAILMIDHQVGTMKLATSRPAAELIHNARVLARVAVALDMPLLLTSSMETHFQGLILEDLQKIAPVHYQNRIKRPGVVNSWTYDEFRKAVLATGRKKLIMCGLTNEVCIIFPSISAVEEGFEVQVVADAGGSPTKDADNIALQRMRDHGVQITSTLQLTSELAQDWSTPTGTKISEIIYEEVLAKLVS